jgi:hypothetical protein
VPLRGEFLLDRALQDGARHQQPVAQIHQRQDIRAALVGDEIRGGGIVVPDRGSGERACDVGRAG